MPKKDDSRTIDKAAILAAVKLSKAGSPVDGEPQPGLYYRAARIDPASDLRQVAKDLKAAFPKSFFSVV